MKIIYLWTSLLLALGAMGAVIDKTHERPPEMPKFRYPIALAEEMPMPDLEPAKLIEELPHSPKQEIVKRLAKEYDLDWRYVWSICKVESNCNSDRIGDNGNSFGAYQIYRPAHPDIPIEKAQDFAWATEWTIKHGLKYKDNITMFAACHNGIGKYPRNQWYVDRVISEFNKIK